MQSSCILDFLLLHRENVTALPSSGSWMKNNNTNWKSFDNFYVIVSFQRSLLWSHTYACNGVTDRQKTLDCSIFTYSILLKVSCIVDIEYLVWQNCSTIQINIIPNESSSQTQHSFHNKNNNIHSVDIRNTPMMTFQASILPPTMRTVYSGNSKQNVLIFLSSYGSSNNRSSTAVTTYYENDYCFHLQFVMSTLISSCHGTMLQEFECCTLHHITSNDCSSIVMKDSSSCSTMIKA